MDFIVITCAISGGTWGVLRHRDGIVGKRSLKDSLDWTDKIPRNQEASD